MQPAYLTAEHPWDLLDWHEAVDALREGHRQGQPRSADIHLHGEHGDLFSRASGIDGVGYGLKAESLFGGNPARGLPTSQGVMLVFAPDDGRLRAMVDSRVITALKTASDSVLAAGYLAAPGSSHLLVVGAGVMAGHLARAYSALFPGLQRISVWSRRPEAAQALAASLAGLSAEVVAVQDLQATAGQADIICTATMSTAPLVYGAWLKAGAHVDLVGGFTPAMRESDDDLVARAAVYVDCRASALQAGDLAQPLAAGRIGPDHVRGDLYDLVAAPGRPEADITVFKNAGGAHLDLMVAARLLQRHGL